MSEFNFKTSVAPEFITLVEKVSTIVHKISGNKLGEKQAFMIETRLKKRMLELGIKTAADYSKFIEQNLQKESGVLVGLITTHHTFFFREFSHFELLKKMLPDLVAAANARADKTIKIWSAACSRGQEAYSIAMFLEFYLPQIDPNVSYTILGSDIDQESVKIASNGVYHQNEIKEVPMNMLGNHWSKGTGDIAMYAKVKESLRKKCQFKAGNLLSPGEVAMNQKFDVIFCRNVFIYFEQHQIEKICGELIKYMQPNGIFFSGISESLTGYKVDFNSIGPSAYKLKTASSVVEKTIARAPAVPLKSVVSASPEILKVMCVDDSSSIHTLLKKILAKEHGFEIVAHAMNGIEAMEKMKTIKVDVITLDIHMPEMDGITYLQKNFNTNHPPVVMLSSASREDADTAIKALKSGASDFVEKPSLQNLEEKGDEIRTKLKSVVSDKYLGFKISNFDIENAKKILVTDVKNSLRVLTASISDMKKVKEFFKCATGSQPSTIMFFEGQEEILNSLAAEYSKDFGFNITVWDNTQTNLKVGEIYFADSKKWCKELAEKNKHMKTSIMCFGNVSKANSELLLNWKNAQLLLEDLGEANNKKSQLKDVASDIVPVTSFAYMSNVYLAKK